LWRQSYEGWLCRAKEKGRRIGQNDRRTVDSPYQNVAHQSADTNLAGARRNKRSGVSRGSEEAKCAAS
jgi:hypothetical protein